MPVDFNTLWDWTEHSRSSCIFDLGWVLSGCLCCWWLALWGMILYFSFGNIIPAEYVPLFCWVIYNCPSLNFFFHLRFTWLACKSLPSLLFRFCIWRYIFSLVYICGYLIVLASVFLVYNLCTEAMPCLINKIFVYLKKILNCVSWHFSN